MANGGPVGLAMNIGTKLICLEKVESTKKKKKKKNTVQYTLCGLTTSVALTYLQYVVKMWMTKVKDQQRHNLPRHDQVAAVFVGEDRHGPLRIQTLQYTPKETTAVSSIHIIKLRSHDISIAVNVLLLSCKRLVQKYAKN